MRKIVLLLGVAVLIAGAWIIFGSMSANALPVGPVEDMATGSLELAPALMREGAVEEALAEGRESDAKRTVVEATEASAATEPEMYRILVTLKDTGEPVAGAKVSYFSSQAIDYGSMSDKERETYHRIASDREKLTHRFGTTVVADSNGVAFIPAEKKEAYLSVTGRHDELYGELLINRDLLDEGQESGLKLELEQDETILVQVLDSLGAPAIDVPLGIRPQGLTESSVYFGELARSEAPDGMARIPHLQLTMRNWQLQGEDGANYVLQARIPGLTDEGRIFDVQNPPVETIVLRLPPTGSIILRTADAEGESLLTDYGPPTLALIPDDPPKDLASYRPSFGQQWRQQPEKDGTSVFRWVVTGKSFLGMAYLGMESVREIFTGPERIDHEVRVTLAIKKRVYSLVGRVLDQASDPLANQRLRMVFATGGGWDSSRSISTDDEGRFTVVVGSQGQEVTLERLSIMFETYGQPSDKSAAMYSMRRSMPLVLGNNDLGDLILGVAPLVAAGRVLVDGKIPEREQFGLQVERLHVQKNGNKTREYWNLEQGMTLKFLEGGRFEIRGESRPERYRIGMNMLSGPNRGGRLDFLPFDQVEFNHGSTDLVIDLHAGGSLHAAVLLDDMTYVQNLWLRVVSTDGQNRQEDADPRYVMAIPLGKRLYGQYSGPQQDQHMYRWGALWPGTYRLEVLPLGARVPLLTLEDIEITGGERNKDPRLDPIDLRGKLRKIKIVLEDRAGRRIQQSNYGPPMVLINDPVADEEIHGYTANNASAVIITAEPYLDLLVVARGYQPREIYGVREDQTVVLEPFPEVLVRIAGGMAELPEGHSLKVALSKKGRSRDERKLTTDRWVGGSLDDWLQPQNTRQAVNAKGEVTIQVEGDGRYTILVTVRNDTSRRSATIKAVEPGTVEVRTSTGPQVFEIQIPEEGLKQAVEQAAKR